MTTGQLVRRSLFYFWRTNVAVVLGVATAVAVLSGALLVGESVRGSLRDLVVQRLGATDLVIAGSQFFRAALAADLSAHPRFVALFDAAVPLISVPGAATVQESGRRAGRILVYGVDERFFAFNHVTPVSLDGDEAAVSPALARELAVTSGDAVLVRVQRPTDLPLESLYSRKETLGRTLRLTVTTVLPPGLLGEFALGAQQGEVLALFVSMKRLAAELELSDRVNTILVSKRAANVETTQAALETIVRDTVSAADVGLRVTPADDGSGLVAESSAGLLDAAAVDAVTRVAAAGGARPRPLLTYLANRMTVRDRMTPYSLVTALPDAEALAAAPPARRPAGDRPPIVLNQWAADDLAARFGDPLTLEYYVWEEPGQLATRSTEFRVAGIIPLNAHSRDFAPDYPGISDSLSIGDWDPPFPVNLRLVRPKDEAYWNEYRTTPKAFVPLDVGQRLWGSRYGNVTSVRVAVPEGTSASAVTTVFEQRLRREIDPFAMGIAVRDVRAEGLAASRGATNFGEYFVYFSFFLVVSALLLVSLFFKLGVEQRVREVGLLRAVGLTPGAVRRLFLAEGVALAMLGSALGAAGGIGYAALLMWALRTWWFDAVGTTSLSLHVSSAAVAGGVAGGVIAAALCIWWSLRSLHLISERSLLMGELTPPLGRLRQARGLRITAVALAAAGVALVAASSFAAVPREAAFFGAAAALLISGMCAAGALLRRRAVSAVQGGGWWPLMRLAARGVSDRPGRTVLAMTVLACATFILTTVDAFRRESSASTDDRHAGTGGYRVMVETLLPIVHDPNSDDGREALNLFNLDPAVRLETFRLLPGDDASCLNLFRPTNPRILAPRDRFLAEGRFAFQSSLATSDAERANPWLLLRQPLPDSAIPVVADANSMTYVLHRGLGEDFELMRGGRVIKLRLVGALRDSIFQSELLMSDENFRALFPEQEGFQFLLAETTAEAEGTVMSALEDGLRDAGADARSTAEHLQSFHRVENTYLSTFQTLGGLGLLLGTVGLATVLLRNVIERRKELALLSAVGYRRSHFLLMAATENALLVAGGLGTGVICALVAVTPAAIERGEGLPLSSSVGWLLLGVVGIALLSSTVAVVAISRLPLLTSLRSE